MLERMNRVSASEFMNLTKTQMYDKAVEMVEKYNRLVDICNDSAERMVELIDRHKVYTSALNKDIVAKDAKIELMQKELDGRKAGYVALKTQMDTKYISIDEYNKIVEQFKEKLANDRAELENDMRYKTIMEYQDIIDSLNKDKDKLKDEVVRLNKCIMNKNESINTGNEAIINLRKEIEAHESENARLSERIKELKEEQKTLVDICNKYKKENGDYAVRVDKLKKEINRLYGVAFAPAHEKEDDNGRAGFKEYIKWIVKEEERKFEESWKVRLNEELAEIFKEEEEKAVKYKPSEIDRFIDFLRGGVDKKRIVDISKGVETELGVSRELFDAAIKALVDDGYREIIGRIPQATNSSVLMDMHVLAAPDVETKETANAENIKSLDFDIPCGSDSIE